jgi:tetratricopeptide (TPR) repeat protein
MTIGPELPKLRPLHRRESGFVPRSSRPLTDGDDALAGGRLYEAAARYHEALEASDDHDGKIAALHGLATVYRSMGSLETALDHLEQIVSMDPRHCTALRETVHLTAVLGRWEALLDAEERLIGLIEDRRELCDELVASGDRWQRGAQDPTRAVARYRQVLRIDNEHGPARARLDAMSETIPRPPSQPSDMAALARVGGADTVVNENDEEAQDEGTKATHKLVPVKLPIDEHLLNALDDEAERRNTCRAQIVHEALKQYLAYDQG